MSGDVVFEFSDKTGEKRSTEDVAALQEAVHAAARAFGYKWSTWGSREAMRKTYADEQARLDAEDTRAMLAEWRRKRDAEGNE